MICPNKNHPDWKDLVATTGSEINAYKEFIKNNFDIPARNEVQRNSISEGTSKQDLNEKIKDKLQKLYPEIKLEYSNNPIWEQGDNVMNQEQYNNSVQFMLKSVDILSSDKAKQIFEKGNKNKWSLDKILSELAIPKEQKQLILNLENEDFSFGGLGLRESIITSLLAHYSYNIEVNIAKEKISNYGNTETYIEGDYQFVKIKNGEYWKKHKSNYEDRTQITKDEYDSKYKGEQPTQHYSGLTVPGGTNYIENEIGTPAITPSIKGHAKFATDNGIGWFRSDDQVETPSDEEYYKDFDYDKGESTFKNTKTRRILEVQSDLFQKGRDKKELTSKETMSKSLVDNNESLDWVKFNKETNLYEAWNEDIGFLGDTFKTQKEANDFLNLPTIDESGKDNNFLQLLNKDSNWVAFFVKSIIQDSAKKGYEKVLFPTGNTSVKIESPGTGINTIDEAKARDEKNLANTGLFYENAVANILKKQGYNPILITDEHGNTWNEVTINPVRELSNIMLQKNEANRIIGQANIKAMTVLIDAVNQKADTLPHEYAHHYIAWYRDTPIVQEAIKKWGSEEALVQSIGEQVVAQKGDALNWWNKFTKWILDKFNNLSKLQKQELTQILTDTFLTRQDLSSMPRTIEKNFDAKFQQADANETLKQEILNEKLEREKLDAKTVGGISFSNREDMFDIYIEETEDDTPETNTNENIPITDNFQEIINHKKAILEKVEKDLTQLSKDRRDPKKDFKKIDEETKRLKNISNVLTEDIEILEGKEITFMFSTIEKEIEEISKILDLKNESSLNDIAETKKNIEFLSILATGIDLNGHERENRVSLQGNYAKKGSEYRDKVNSLIADIEQLKKDRTAKQMDAIIKLLEGNIVYANNIDGKIDKEIQEKIIYDLKNLDKLKDIDYLSAYVLGVGDSDTNDSILNQIAKTHLEMQIAIRESQADKYKDKLNVAINNLTKKGEKDFDFIFEKDKYGFNTTNIISATTDVYRAALQEFYGISKRKRTNGKSLSKKEIIHSQINWVNDNAVFIDFTKLKYFKDIYGQMYQQDYTATETEMEEYEKLLKYIDPVVYKQMVSKIEDMLRNYENEKSLLETSDSKYKDKNIAEMNPYLFFKLSNRKDAISYETSEGASYKTYSNLKYVAFMPSKIKKSINYETNTTEYVDTGFYNKSFKEVAADKDKLDYWETMTEVYSEYINPTFSDNYSDRLSYAKFEDEMFEVISGIERLKDVPRTGINVASKAKQSFKEMFYEKGGQTDREGVLRSYSDNSKKEIKELAKAFEKESPQNIAKLAKIYGIDTTKVLPADLINLIATQKVLSSYSKNINKTTFALINMTSLQKAREDTDPIADMLIDYQNVQSKGKRKKASAKFENWVNVIVKNKTLKYRGSDDSFGKELPRKTVLQTFLAFLGKIKWVKNFVNENSLILLSKNEQYLLAKLLESKEAGIDTTKENNFEVKEFKYFAILGDDGEMDYIKYKDKIQTPISEKEYQDAFSENIDIEIENMGLDLSVAGIAEGIMKTIIMSRLGLNPISGIFNRVEGKNTNTIMDATNNYWTAGNLAYADLFMAGSNAMSFVHDKIENAAINNLPGFDALMGENIRQLRVFKAMIKKMNIIQDRKNELDKSAQSSKVEESLDMYKFAVSLAEGKTQGSIALCVLMDTEIRSKDGRTKTRIFDKTNGVFPAHELVEGKLVLKEEFRTKENISNWEDFSVDEINAENNSYLLTKLKIKKAISRTQGNYDANDTLLVSKTITGKAMTMFMKWLPEHYMQRYGSGEQFDMVTGKYSPKGRYRHLWSDNPTLYAATTVCLFASYGMNPILGGGIALACGIKTAVEIYKGRNTWNGAIGELLKLTSFAKAIAMGTLSYPLVMFNLKAPLIKAGNKFGVNLNLNDNFLNGLIPSYKTTKNRTNLTEEQINNFRAIALEIGATLNYLIMINLYTMLSYNDDDDSKSSRRMRQNFIHNQLNRLLSSLSVYTDPRAFIKDSTRFGFIKQTSGIFDVGQSLYEGDGKAMEKLVDLGPVPKSILKVTRGGSLFEDKKQFDKGWVYERAVQKITGVDKKLKKELQDKRTELKEDMREKLEENDKLTSKEINDAIDKEFRSKYRTKKQIEADIKKEKEKEKEKKKGKKKEVKEKKPIDKETIEEQLKRLNDQIDEEENNPD